MAPKPRPIPRKPPTTPKETNTPPLQRINGAQSMPPPPLPARPPSPQGMLVPEAQALSGCLRVSTSATYISARWTSETYFSSRLQSSLDKYFASMPMRRNCESRHAECQITTQAALQTYSSLCSVSTSRTGLLTPARIGEVRSALRRYAITYRTGFHCLLRFFELKRPPESCDKCSQTRFGERTESHQS